MFFKNQKIDKYQIVDTIGSGGFGNVYLAVDTMINKYVAIKVPHKQGENLDKLLAEPRMLAALDHPNIVRVITADVKNEVFYIVMEYVKGTSLEQLLRKHKRLDMDQALNWFAAIINAMIYAHGKKVIHRDLRPANVLIDMDGQVKVTDLGTSRYLSDGDFASTRIGSPPYMAPEHFKGKATFQSDVYSMGVMMYECLTGTLPFFDANPQRMARLAQEAQAKPPHHYNPSIPLELSQIVLKAMHRSLISRYQSARDLAESLADFKRRSIMKPRTETPRTEPVRGLEPEPEKPAAVIRPTVRVKERPSRDFSDLFCWNCERPISKRTQTCPHCNVLQKF